MLTAAITSGMTTTTSSPTSPTPTSTPTSAPLTSRTSLVLPKDGTAPSKPTFTCTNNVCVGTGTTDFLFRTFQGLINMALAQLGKTGFVQLTKTIPVNGQIDQTTLNGFLPVSRAVGGTLAIFDITPTPQLLAQNAAAYSIGIAQWLGVTWIEATATVPGHWERLRAGQTSVLPKPPTTTPTAPALCPPPAVSTSVGCLWPQGTITNFHKGRKKWRIAVPLSALPPSAPTSGGMSVRAPLPATGFGYDYGLGTANFVVVAEQDFPPQNVQQVDDASFATMVGESTPTTGVTPTAPPPPPTPTTPAAPTVTLCPPGTIATSQGCLATQSSASAPSADLGPAAFPETPFVTAPTKQRYAGCIARFNRTRRVFSIYCPISSPAAGLGRAGVFASYTGLGADTVTPPPPAGFVKTAEVATLPGAGETAAGEEKDKFFRVNNPVMWIAIIGTVAAVGGGGYWLMRRRKMKPAGFGDELFGQVAA